MKTASTGSPGAILPGGAAFALGTLLGLGGFAIVYGDGAAYLGDDPTSCANCHVMQGHLDTWLGSSHRAVATCNDCHLPPGFFGKWLTKADNGLLHSVAFTFGGFPDPIRIKPRNRDRTQAACLDCHAKLFHASAAIAPGSDGLTCSSCHADVGHALR